MMEMWVGVDDTDSTQGGCTTFLTTLLIEAAHKLGYRLTMLPALVRLNPNIKYKTRGNGAVCFHIIKEKSGIKDAEELFNTLRRIIDLNAKLGDKNTNPGLIVTNVSLQKDYYWKGVREIVDIDTREKEIKSRIIQLNDSPEDFLLYHKWKNGRGIIGASSAISWLQYRKNDCLATPGSKQESPGQCYKNPVRNGTTRICKANPGECDIRNTGRGFLDKSVSTKSNIFSPSCMQKNKDYFTSYELITYRDKKSWGSKRYIDTQTPHTLDQESPGSFNNYDKRNNHIAIYPNSPCPVLYGVRSLQPDKLLKCLSIIKGEKWSKYLLFQSNQASDDHIQLQSTLPLMSDTSIKVQGKVVSSPRVIRGGHVFFRFKPIYDDHNIQCAAFEPTKEFRDDVRELKTGDVLEIFGGLRKNEKQEDYTLNIEKFQLIELAPGTTLKMNPLCPNCSMRLKSAGEGKGFKCKKCRSRFPDGVLIKDEIQEKRQIRPGWYQVPICARRHLFQPREFQQKRGS